MTESQSSLNMLYSENEGVDFSQNDKNKKSNLFDELDKGSIASTKEKSLVNKPNMKKKSDFQRPSTEINGDRSKIIKLETEILGNKTMSVHTEIKVTKEESKTQKKSQTVKNNTKITGQKKGVVYSSNDDNLLRAPSIDLQENPSYFDSENVISDFHENILDNEYFNNVCNLNINSERNDRIKEGEENENYYDSFYRDK